MDEAGSLTLNKATVSGGRATDCPLLPGQGICGGGINSQGTTVNHSRVVHNAADSAGTAWRSARACSVPKCRQ
ncbi:hypothetical protein Slala05_82010 [Streptomyces lavendulae subsp. lavendulae]|nr:hypothetical protein Slala05_82010 [Streptomyces lavendulae subsp. lavendulae]